MRKEIATHEIIGVVEPVGSDELAVKVKVTGSGVFFKVRPKELYTKDWLGCFSSEDVAYIGFLNAAVYSDGLIPIEYFPRKNTRLTPSVIVIAILFICFFIMSNLTAFRVAEITLPWRLSGSAAAVSFPAALVVFPATYVLSSILTEVYGYKISRLVIWGGLAANLLLVVGLAVVALLPTSDDWARHAGVGVSELTYAALIEGYARTFLASSIAYFVSEFANSMALAKLKVAHAGRNRALRVLASVTVAITLDSAIFCPLLFFGVMEIGQIFLLILVQILVKFTYQLTLLPVTLRISKFLKDRDGIDYYDFDTKFNPFAINDNAGI